MQADYFERCSSQAEYDSKMSKSKITVAALFRGGII